MQGIATRSFFVVGILLTATATGLVFPQGTSATEHFYVPGATCIATTTTGTAAYTTKGLLANGSTTSDLTVVCPIRRPVDQAGSADSLYVTVDGTDDSSTEDVSCQVWACNSDSSGCTNSGYVDSSALNYSMNVANALYIGSRPIVAVECTIPNISGTYNNKVHVIEVLFN